MWDILVHGPRGGEGGETEGGDYNVGDTGPAGGIVFYDKGSNNGGWRYLEAAPANVEGTRRWGGYGMHCGVTATDIGAGAGNTETLAAHTHKDNTDIWDETGHPAAKACADYSYGGYDDWFLPSRDELYELHKQKTLVGGFDSGTLRYWSSSEAEREEENSVFYAWILWFIDDPDHNLNYPDPREHNDESIEESVRAVRRF
jgi:hypothetical protein